MLKPGRPSSCPHRLPAAFARASWHFYNCTRYGLAEWFKAFETETPLRVSDNFCPNHSIAWLASECEGRPPQGRFLRCGRRIRNDGGRFAGSNVARPIEAKRFRLEVVREAFAVFAGGGRRGLRVHRPPPRGALRPQARWDAMTTSFARNALAACGRRLEFAANFFAARRPSGGGTSAFPWLSFHRAPRRQDGGRWSRPSVVDCANRATKAR